MKETWKNTWNFDIANDINIALFGDEGAYISQYIGVLYGDGQKWSWHRNDKEGEKTKHKITDIFNELFDNSFSGL